MPNFLDKISIYLFLLIPVFLITGPFLPDLSLSLIVIIFLYQIIKNKDWNKLNNKFFYVFISLCLFLITNSLLSENVILSLKPTLFYFRFGIFCFATFYLMSKYSDRITENLFKVILFIILILIFGQLYDLIFQKNILTGEIDNEFRHTGFFGDDEIIGSYISRLFPFFLFIFLIKKPVNKKLIFAMITLVGLIVFLSSERTSFFFYLVSIIIFLLLSDKNIRKVFILNLLIILSILTIFYTANKEFKDRVNFTYKQFTVKSAGAEKIVMFSSVHQSHYNLAFKMFKEKPIFGHGVKMFRHFCSKKENYIDEYACSTHPHNVPMQLLAETGILLTILVYFFYLILLIKIIGLIYERNFKKNYNINYAKVCFLTSILITFFPLAPSGNFFDNWLSLVYYYPIGVYLWYLRNTKQENYY